MREPPTTEAWRAIIGPATPDDQHLIGPGGLFLPPATTELLTARTAIYVSSLGKVYCEEAGTCRFTDYLQWFRDLGLTGELQQRQVDVLTDEMVRSGDLSQYVAIYLPYAPSRVLDEGACLALARRRGTVFQQTSTGEVVPFRACP
jgi:hypothetical protein